jgi:hypothetical protein
MRDGASRGNTVVPTSQSGLLLGVALKYQLQAGEIMLFLLAGLGGFNSI